MLNEVLRVNSPHTLFFLRDCFTKGLRFLEPARLRKQLTILRSRFASVILSA